MEPLTPAELDRAMNETLNVDGMTPKEAADFLEQLITPGRENMVFFLMLESTGAPEEHLIKLARKGGLKSPQRIIPVEELQEKIRMFRVDSQKMTPSDCVLAAIYIANDPGLEAYFRKFEASEEHNRLAEEAFQMVMSIIRSARKEMAKVDPL